MNDIDSNNQISLFVAGDFSPAEINSEKMLGEGSEKQILGELLQDIGNADLAVTNLECPLTLTDNAVEKICPNLKAHPLVAAFCEIKEVRLANSEYCRNRIFLC